MIQMEYNVEDIRDLLEQHRLKRGVCYDKVDELHREASYHSGAIDALNDLLRRIESEGE